MPILSKKAAIPRISNLSWASGTPAYLAWVVLVLLILRPTVSAQTANFNDDRAARYTLKGTVISSVTGEPIRRALVELVADSIQARLTDSDGHFQFDGLRPMQVSVSLIKPGFFEQDEVSMESSAQPQIQVGPQQEEVVLKMTPESVVAGLVTDIRGAPLEGIPVKLHCVRVTNGHRKLQRCGNAFTDEDGQFRFSELTPGSYYVEAGPSVNYRMMPDLGSTEPAERYASVLYPGATAIDQATTLDIAAGQQVEADFSLQPEPQAEFSNSSSRSTASAPGLQLLPVAANQRVSRISGTVVNALTGRPVRRAKVTVALGNDTVSPRTVMADENGQFTVAGLMQGKYALTVESRGFLPLGRTSLTPYWVDATATGEPANLMLGLQPYASLSGTISDDQNEAVRDAQVMLFRSVREGGEKKTRFQSQLSTDEAGHYRFSHLPPGTYFVAVTALPWYAQYRQASWGSNVAPAEIAPESVPDDLDVAYPITFYSSYSVSTDPSTAEFLRLRPGDRTEADVTLRPVPALHLLVRNASPDPSWPGSAVLMESVGYGFATRVPAHQTTINGSLIEITGVPPGHYLISLHSFGGQNTATRSRKLYVPSDIEIDGNQI